MVLVLRNQLSELERLAEAVEQFGEQHGLSPKIIYALNLSLDELFTNVVSYGFGDDTREHEITIRFLLENGELTLVMEDDGRAFNPLEKAAPQLEKPVEDRAVGGLGIFFVRKTMDQLEYRRESGRNVLTMKKLVKPAASPTS